MKKIVLSFVLFLSLVTLIACGDEKPDPTPNVPTAAVREELLVKAFVAFLNTSTGKSTIQNKGGIVEVASTDKTWDQIKADHVVATYDNSDITLKFGGSTSVQSIAEALSSQFAPLAGNFVPEHNHTGSGDAFKRTQGSEKDGANNLHIGFASRAFSQAEKEGSKFGTYDRLAWDAVVAVVNEANAATNLTTKQLNDIYSKPDLSWSNYGGGASTITPYTRDSASGTREAFFEVIGLSKSHNEAVAAKAETVDSNGAMITQVKGNASGIGYISLSGLAASGLKGLNFNGVEATEANVLNDTYALKRPFNYITRAY